MKYFLTILVTLSVIINVYMVRTHGVVDMWTKQSTNTDTLYISSNGKTYPDPDKLEKLYAQMQEISSKIDSIKPTKQYTEFSVENVDFEELFNTIKNDIYKNENLPYIPTSFAPLESSSGMYSTDGKRRKIELDANKKFTLQSLKDIYAHEIIHYYLDTKNKKDNHGNNFRAEMRRINNLGLGYNVELMDIEGEWN